jgi:hypothetical protein
MIRTARFAAPALGAALLGVAACAVVEPTVVETPKGLIQRALALCDEKTEAAETRCVRTALVDQHVTVQALAAMIPGCKLGTACILHYTTRDRAGLLSATATQYVFDWQVTFDLKSTRVTGAEIPFKVLQV